jgi:hypothetical protein
MASHAPVALDYEVSTVFYPRLRDAPRWWLILVILLPPPVVVGCWMVVSGGMPLLRRAGALYLGMSGLALGGLTLLYIPAATWLCVNRTGITLSIAFWRRSVAWSRVRDVRLVVWDGGVTSDPVVEVVLNEAPRCWWTLGGQFQSRHWIIHPRSFGWSPQAVIGVMERWLCDGARA